MGNMKLDLTKEICPRGMYAAEKLCYGVPYTKVERISQPITPAENILLYYRGEDYEWIPDLVSDEIDITPPCNPDVVASSYTGGYDAFGVKWIPLENGELPAFVEPGFILLDDIGDWKSLEWPDPDTWEWERDSIQYNATYQGDDRLRRGIILSGYFERLISIMGFEGAAMSLLTDPESVAEFFNKLTDFNKKIMKHYFEDFDCKAILIHDDWSAQRSPFFSMKVVSELIVHQIKKLTDYAHDNGAIMTLHSCGNGQALIQAIIATGADGWQAQVDAMNLDKIYEECGDNIIIEFYPFVPEGIRGEELEQYIRDMMFKYCIKHKGLIDFYDLDIQRWPETRKIIYEVGRELTAESRK